MVALNGNLKIGKDRLLLVEGNDEDRFFSGLLTKIHPTGRPIQIIPTDGKDKLDYVLALLVKQSEFANVARLGIVRDADNDGAAAFTSIQSLITKCSLPTPIAPEKFAAGTPMVGVFIMPGCERDGALENLCLDAVESSPQMRCVNDFADCIGDKGLKLSVSREKLRMQAYVATIGNARLIGEAADRGALNFDSPAYSDLRKFLGVLLT